MYYVYYSVPFLDLIIYSVLTFGVCFIMIGLSYVLSDQNMYSDKTVGYECGFDPFSSAQDPFNIKFYIIAMLFILFDIELVFFLPWLVSLNTVSFFGFYVMYFFYIFLMLGFLYEWKNNSLNWD